MIRVLLLVSLFISISIKTFGQCKNGPTVVLSISQGITCGITPIIVTDNTFGGSATLVTIAENGEGSVTPISASRSPFTFTYTPKSGDLGKKVTITVTTNNPMGRHCIAAKATFTLMVNANSSAPVTGTITQPRFGLPAGSVVLNGLPESGTWTLTQFPGNVTISGTGITKTISGLAPGTYNFSVTNTSGCTSDLSANVVINSLPVNPVVVITNPAPKCFPSTIDLAVPSITAGSTLYLTYTYWVDVAATIPYSTPASATDGTYYIKGTSTDGYFNIKPVRVSVFRIPLANAGPDQVLNNKFVTSLDAELTNNFETAFWSTVSGSGNFFDAAYAKTSVTGLSLGKNKFLWTVTNGVCPAASASVIINVHDRVIPTLITPNMDGKNDYFIVKNYDSTEQMELIIFDRRGVQVYKNIKYDNSWNGVDYNGKLLPDDTYFYVLRKKNGSSANGYIVIRR